MKKPKWVLENGEWKLASKKRRKPFYSSMQLVRQTRHWLTKNVKRVFDTESDANLKKLEIKEKAKKCGLTVRQYDEALARLDKLTTGKLALVINQLELDFLANWIDRMEKATKWAEEKKDYRAILALEKERMLMMKRLVAAGRIVNPFSEQKDEDEEEDDEFPHALTGDPDFPNS